MLALAALGCAGQSKPPPRPATLVIIGGGNLDDTPIRSAFLSRVRATPDDPGRILVLPTASGVPDESGLGTARALQRLATRHTVDVIMLTEDDPARADDPATAQQIRDADGLWFTGGDQSRITSVFRTRMAIPLDSRIRPPGTPDGPSHADDALRAMLARGGTVAGTSAGAAMMGHPMIAGGSSDAALLHGAGDAGVKIKPGMGLFPFMAIFDQHFLERGRLGRLIAALEATDTRFGFGIEEGAAIVVTLGGVLGDAPDLAALGPDSVLIVDNAGALRSTVGDRTGIRISLLGTGDRFDMERFHAVPHPSKQDRTRITLPFDGPAHDPQRDAWEPGAIRDAIHSLAADPAIARALVSEHFLLIFIADDETRFYLHPDNRDDLFADNIRLDIRRIRDIDGQPAE